MGSIAQRAILICGVQFDAELRSAAMSLSELAPIAVRLGASGIEHRNVYWQDKARELPEVRAQMDELGIKATYATTTTLFNGDPRKQSQLLQDLEDAHALGSPLLRVFPGDPPGAGPEGEAMLAAARAVLHRAEELGMRLALENHRSAYGRKLSDVKETLERLDSSVLGANIDVSNYVINGQDVVEAIRALLPWVIYCHLKDA
ncbi:MAG: sugar phosphate isomerase/epimerase family protein, partial [Chloroflexota bacterium]